MRKTTALLIIIYILCQSLVYALAGKPKTIENVKVYYEAPSEVSIELFTFKNQTGNKDLDYLSITIPEITAKQIERKNNIIISSNNIRITPRGYEAAYNYKVFTLSNFTYTTNIVSNEIVITTNVNLTYMTNEMKPKTNVIIKDALYSNLSLSSNEILYYYNNKGVILSNNNDFKRKPNILNNFVKYEKDDVKNYALTRSSDIVVYGDIKSTRYTVLITVYVAETHSKKISSYSFEINYAEIEESLPMFCLEVANRIDGIEKTGIVKINTNPSDALIYIDEIYMGKTGSNSIYIPSLTVGEHRITIEKEDYERVDKIFSFQKPLENIDMTFSLLPLTNFGRIVINVPGGTNTTVIFDGIKEAPAEVIEKNLNYGTYALKMIREDYNDYFATITLNSKDPLIINPNMKQMKKQTVWRKIFGNYERNTKIALGATVVLGIATLAANIYANEIYDITVTKYFSQYRNDPNPPPINLKKYNTAYNLYIAGVVTTSVFALTAGIYYMLWISQPNFPVEQFASIQSTGDGANITYSLRF